MSFHPSPFSFGAECLSARSQRRPGPVLGTADTPYKGIPQTSEPVARVTCQGITCAPLPESRGVDEGAPALLLLFYCGPSGQGASKARS